MKNLCTILLAFLSFTASSQIFYSQSFETTNGYSFPNGNGVGTNTQDFFDRTDLAGAPAQETFTYNGFDGTFFIAAEDIDGVPLSSSIGQVYLDNIDISSQTNIFVTASFASGTDIDIDEVGDSISVQARIDNGNWVVIGKFEVDSSTYTSTGGPFNGQFAEDTDGDGYGDGVRLNGNFTDFTWPVAGSGDSLDIRIFVDLDAGDEEAAFDNIRVSSGPPPTNYTLQILHASDLEGGVDAITRARFFAAIIDTLEGEYSNSVTLSAGDNYIPGPFFNAANDQATFRSGGVFNNVYNRHFGVTSYDGLREAGGRADVTIMNIIGFDASAFGNHEFDAGESAIFDIIEEDFRTPAGPAADRWVGAQFPYLSSNLDFSSSSLNGAYVGTVEENTTFQSGPAASTAGGPVNKIAAATYIDRGGERIGVVGVTTPLLASISSPGGVVVKGPGAGTNDLNQLAAEIQPWIDSLTINQGINKVILVTHLQQIQLEEALAPLLSGVDVIIAGGSDAILANAQRLEAGATVYKPYPILTANADNDTCAIVSTDGEYSYVGRLVIEFDSQGKVIPSSIDPVESGPYISDSLMVNSTWGNFNNAFSDPNGKGALVDSITSAVTSIVSSKDGNILGNTSVYLNGERGSVRTEETNFGNLTADANLWVAKQFDQNVMVSIKNGGGIRAAIGEVVEVSPGNFQYLPPQANPLSGKQNGDISQLDIENSLKFNNGLTVLDLTASGLKDVIEHGVAAWAPNATPGQMCQVGGLMFSFDPSQAAGSRVVDMMLIDSNNTVLDTVVLNGAVFGNASRTIKVVTLNFLAGGGDNYPYPTLATNLVDLDTASAIGNGNANFITKGTEQDALAEYLLAKYGSSATPFNQADQPIFLDRRIENLSAMPPVYTLQMLHASDLEGGVEAIERAKFFAAIVDTLEGEYANSITLSAGDNYIPGPFYNAAGDRATFRDGGVFNNVYNRHFGITGYNGLREGPGRADITIMNLIGFDASAIGNHEFDAGPDGIEAIIQQDFRTPNGPAGDRWVGAQFPYLSANLDFSGSLLNGIYTGTVEENTNFVSGPVESTAGNNSINKIAAATYITRGGEKIGVVGVTTPLLGSISSPTDVSVKGPVTNDLMALAAEVQPWIDSLTINQGINKVILVTHLQQIQLEEQLAGMLNGIDIIVAGGSDAILANPGDRLLPGSTPYKAYPILTPNGDGDTCAIVSTDGEYSYVGRLVADFDFNGILIPSSIRPESGPYLADSMMVASTWGSVNSAFADPNGKAALVDSITSAVTGIVIAKDGNILGLSDVYLNGQREAVRTEETNLGNLSADANLWQALQVNPNVKVSIKNGGGIRAAIGEVSEVAPGQFEFLPPQANPLSGKQDGEVSQLDVENSLRFNNSLSILDLSAAGLKEVLEHGVAAWAPTATPGQMCQVGGVEFSFDPTLAPGSRIQSMVLVDTAGNETDTIVRNGALVGDTGRTITIVTLGFLAGGGDSYPFPALGSNRMDLDTSSAIGAGNFTFSASGFEQDAIAEYFNSLYSSNPYDEADVPIEKDERIQILSRRADAIFGVEVAFKEGRIVLDETAGTADVVVYYDNNTSVDQTITWGPLSISTADGSDYSLSAASGLALANTEDSIIVTATIVNDGTSESDEIVFVEIPSSLDYYFEDEEDQAFVLFIQDDDNVGPTATNALDLQLLTSYGGLVNAGSTEILDYDPVSQRLFVTNSSDDRFEILDMSNPSAITRLDSIDISSFGGINSLNVYSGGSQPVIAVAIEAGSTNANGEVVFFDTNGVVLANVTVGVLPDMVTFTPDGQKVVVACEGEPNDDYTVDPIGSIGIIDVSGGFSTLSQANVTVLDFTAYDGQEASLRAQGIRIFGPGASASQDLEPEYVAISPDNSTAYVACQEANAVAVVDLVNDTITALIPLGWKDHSLPGNGLDSDRDSDEITIAQAPFRGFYMPDAIATYEVSGQVYILSANEGDSRDYDGYSEEERLDDLEYDVDSFPNPELLLRAYGDIKVTSANGDIDNDGKYEHIYTYGARSFSVWNGTSGALVYDSGDDFEQIISNSDQYSPLFNVSDDDIEIKDRSDDKGPEPEAVVVGEVNGIPYAFIGMERTGGVMVYNVNNPNAPEFVTVNIPRDTATGGGDQAPEGLIFIPAASSPNSENLLLAANEASNTISIWTVNDTVTSIAEFGEVKAGLVLYPNPADNEVYLAAKNGSMEMIEIFDMNGRLVHSQNANRELHRLDVGRLEAGLYIVKVYTDKGIESLKLKLQ